MLRIQEPFEWYFPYDQFSEIVNERVAKSARISELKEGDEGD